MHAEILSLRLRFNPDVILAVANERPRHPELDHRAAWILTVSPANRDCAAVAIGGLRIAYHSFAVYQHFYNVGGHEAGSVVAALFLGFRRLDSPKPIGGAVKLQGVTVAHEFAPRGNVTLWEGFRSHRQ
jgi:hypothetical protein